MSSYSRIAHQNLEICSPAPWDVYQTLLSSLHFPASSKILEIGCGKCGILSKSVALLAGTGVGVDLADSLADDLTGLAKELRSSDKLQLVIEPAESFLKNSVTKFDLIICVGSSHAVGGLEQAFEKFQSHLNIGGKVIFGEIVWKAKPSEDFLAFLECEEKDQLYPEQLFQLAEHSGFSVIDSVLCSESDFESYESELKASITDWCTAHPDKKETSSFKERSEEWWEAREKWARNAFGFVVVSLKTVDDRF
jgi:cyclopropane fatty-acyl-phospholipid synthase-like methyltransferase